jgi:hypothetical protein
MEVSVQSDRKENSRYDMLVHKHNRDEKSEIF